MAIPDPRTSSHPPAPPGFLRVVAWRQRTVTWPHPDLVPLHAERAILLHRWATDNEIDVGDWGATDAERPAEFVEFLLDVGQATLVAGLGALASEHVKAYFERKKVRAANRADTTKATQAARSGPIAESSPVTPLFAISIVNQSGGTVVVMNPPAQQEIDRLLGQVMDARWRGREIVA